ncbi:MAG: dTDP-4-amino-4,6-dideoxygalactose transaminase, partial [Acidobacteria bacterium]|nr:dTDP-4-amino-4,6-dideoxygalactose transaminase [Acidobacteriota bacterium]
MSPSVPFNVPCRTGAELAYISQALENQHLSGDGPFTLRCREWLERSTGATRALLTTSCTHALEMAALLLNVGPGDEVICPAFTFVSTVNAFVLRGAMPVFVDIRPDTLNIDERRIEAAITPRTKAIVAVHYACVSCDMDRICDLAAARGIPVVEDNAHGLFGRFHGRPLGSFAPLATLSFHDSKNVTCGEGGALLINAPQFVERAEIIREKGTNRSRFFRGEVDKYTWVDVGSSYLLSEILAASLLAQLEQSAMIQAGRREIWDRYQRDLADWAGSSGVTLPTVPDGCEPAYHLFYMLLPTAGQRPPLMQHLKRHSVGCTFHYQPLHLSDMGRRFGGRPGQCPVTESVADRLVRLPMFYPMSDEQLTTVVDT